MRYRVDKNSKKSAYLQLYEQFREDIVSGSYRYGQKLPSKRTLSEETGVSVITVEHAYGLLCEEGYAEGKERSGYIVIFRSDDGFMSVKSTLVYHDYGSSADIQFPFSVFSKTMRRVISEYGEQILQKSPPLGSEALREELSRYLERNKGIKASKEQIVIGSGAEYLYGLIVELLGRDKIYGIEYPSYEKIEKVYLASGVKIERLPLLSDGIDGEALKKTSAQVLHVSPYRSFPSGVTATASKRHEYARWAKKTGRFIVEDDFESEYSLSKKNEETLYSLTEKENVIYLNTFTRTVSPSLRIGYMVLPPVLANEFQKRLGFYSCSVPTFEQIVLSELISSGDFERHINRVRRKARRESKRADEL